MTSASEEGKIESLANKLRERIKRGDFGTSGRLPTVTQMAKEYGMARATVYQSLLLLRSEGILIVKGTSYMVNYPLMRIENSPLFDQFLIEQGLVPVTDNLADPEIIPAPAEMAEMLGLKEGEPVIVRSRRQGTAEVPYRLHENWYSLDLGEPFLEEMKQDPNLNVAGRIRETRGIGITTIRDRVITRLPTSEEIELLRIVRTTPVLEVKKQFLSEDGRTIMVVRSILVGAFFELNYEQPHRRKGSK